MLEARIEESLQMKQAEILAARNSNFRLTQFERSEMLVGPAFWSDLRVGSRSLRAIVLASC
jgi:hypothetical protein